MARKKAASAKASAAKTTSAKAKRPLTGAAAPAVGTAGAGPVAAAAGASVVSPADLVPDHLRPYLAAVFLEASGKLKDQALAQAVLQDMKLALSDTRTEVHTNPPAKFNGLTFASLVVRETRAPAWLAGNALADITHHLAIVAVQADKVALVVSDSALRRTMEMSITHARVVSRDLMARAFIGDQASVVWLNGVHAQVSVKPDSKTLTGSALEDALDPLGDQTYTLSALRSRPEIGGLANAITKEAKTIGVAPGVGRIWLGRPASWNDFTEQIGHLLAHLSSPPAVSDRFSYLAQPVTSLGGVRDAYAVAVRPSVLLDHDAPQAELDKAERWARQARYAVTAIPKSPNLLVEVSLDGHVVGKLGITVSSAPTKSDPEKMEVVLAWRKRGADKKLADECREFLDHPHTLVLSYDSGHAVADGRCFLRGHTDQVLPWKFVDFTGYDLHNEKPPVPAGSTLVDCILDPVDTSLFGYIKKSYTTGWLACDDGSMEAADFIHFDEKTQQLTLIHAKATAADETTGMVDPNRRVSVSDYEVVVAQGIKNIRHLNKDKLAQRLEEGKGKAMARAIWRDGVLQPNRKGLVAALRAATRVAPVLAILQPRLTKARHDDCLVLTPKPKVSEGERLRFKQLNALMLTARSSAMAAGAEFVAYGAK